MCRQNGDWRPDEKNYDNSYTINDITDSMLFIHPPRDGKYRILQFCPYPYFINGTPDGVWNWDFEIGPYWATPPTYPILGVDTFRISYTYCPGQSICTTGNAMTYTIFATSESKYGKATSLFTINSNGLIHWTAVPGNGHTFRFDLLERVPGAKAIANNPQFAHLNAAREEKIRSTKPTGILHYLGVSDN